MHKRHGIKRSMAPPSTEHVRPSPLHSFPTFMGATNAHTCTILTFTTATTTGHRKTPVHTRHVEPTGCSISEITAIVTPLWRMTTDGPCSPCLPFHIGPARPPVRRGRAVSVVGETKPVLRDMKSARARTHARTHARMHVQNARTRTSTGVRERAYRHKQISRR